MECAKCGKEVSYPSFYVIDGLVGSGGQVHCPECYRKYLMEIGSVKPPKTYNRRGVEVDERST